VVPLGIETSFYGRSSFRIEIVVGLISKWLLANWKEDKIYPDKRV